MPPGHGDQRFALAYFKTVLILEALDTNHDGVISAEEMEQAPAALRTLDKNHDGKLDPAECGMHLPPVKMDKNGKPVTPSSNPVEVKRRKEALLRARFLYMHIYPVTHALDLNHDGVISADEIRNAPAALATLDLNGDGRLTLNELEPDPVAHEVAGLFGLDSDLDGKISRSEWLTESGQYVSALLEAADRDHDGQVTWEELEDEISLRADLNHDGVVTWEELMSARKAGLLGGSHKPNAPGFRSPGMMPHPKSQPSATI
jgi:Ca2+-binding EF-hand superfamily protein